MKTSTILTIFLFSVQAFGTLVTNSDGYHEREQFSKIERLPVYQIFTGTNAASEKDSSENEVLTPIQLARCETTGLGGSTNRNACYNP